MRKVLRWLGYLLGLIVLLALLFAAWVWFASGRVLSATHEAAPERLARPTPEQLADAPRQARILGCVHCHGEGLSGQLMFEEPAFATIWASNLTHVAAEASDQQLAQAIRQGVGHDGRALWIMPSELYSRLSDAEVAALIAMLRSLPRAGNPTPAVAVGPIGRFAIATGGLRPVMAMIEDYRVRQPYDVGADHAAGRRLASTSCAGCHGPDLTGGEAGPESPAPDLAIAGAYDLDQFRTLLRTGRPPSGRDQGAMREVAVNNFAHYSDEEIGQLYGYLRVRAERVAR